MQNLSVKCYSGYIYPEEPRAFRWQGANRAVCEIIKRWQVPGQRCFRVRTGENKLFELCYHEAGDRWSGAELVRS